MSTERGGLRQDARYSREAAPVSVPDLAPPVPPLGKRGVLKLSAEEAATRLARMHAARRTPAERRMEAQRLAQVVTGMTLDEARRHIRPREYSVAALHLAGMSLRQIQGDAWVLATRLGAERPAADGGDSPEAHR